MYIEHLDDLLDLVVQDQHDSATHTTKDVGEGTLEEGTDALVLGDLHHSVDGARVKLLLGASAHHQPTTDSVEGVRDDTGSVGHNLGHQELEHERRVVGEEGILSGIVQTEISATVHDDTLDGHTEALVQRHGAGGLGNLAQAVEQTVELTALAGADIGGETGTGEIKGVHDQEGGGTGETTGSHLDAEELPEVGLGAVGGEQCLNGVLEGKVERLGGEVTHDVGDVAAPEGGNTLLGSHAAEAVDDAGVAGDLARDNLGVGVLGLDQELDTLNGSSHGLGDSTGHTTRSQILGEGGGVKSLLLGGDHHLLGGRVGERGGGLAGSSSGHQAGHAGLLVDHGVHHVCVGALARSTGRVQRKVIGVPVPFL
mmetsp:Transcript_16361/g.35559  ORF Transcript_16361/g.35559 Transcript_16361/m.35559 type:complete len:369 (-) Transcript_16361:25-1131(-)